MLPPSLPPYLPPFLPPSPYPSLLSWRDGGREHECLERLSLALRIRRLGWLLVFEKTVCLQPQLSTHNVSTFNPYSSPSISHPLPLNPRPSTFDPQPSTLNPPMRRLGGLLVFEKTDAAPGDLFRLLQNFCKQARTPRHLNMLIDSVRRKESAALEVGRHLNLSF